MSPIPRLRDHRGPALLSYGFRPFFLLGAIYAGLTILAWLPMFHGELEVTSAFAPVDWHVHEMLYGYLPAIVTGFLLTAIPNWTGRLPIQGAPLLVLVLLWVAGRVCVTMSAQIGWLPAAIVDVSFLVLVIAAATREIVAGNNWRNLRVIGMVGLLLAGNVAFHIEAHIRGHAEYGTRIGIAAIVLLLALIGGRIIPSFTRNWLARENPGRLPAPFTRFDGVTIAVSAASLALWSAQPSGRVTAAALAVAAVLNAVRLARWAGNRTLRDRLVLILHVGYAFVPLGFLLVGLGALDIVTASAGLHAWMVGAAGTLTLAVMTRASLGHTGNALIASPATQAIYAAIVVAALARICSSLQPAWFESTLYIAAFAWAAAFLGFAVAYGSLLVRPKPGTSQ
ncbi:MAG: NnrS family protein [Bradyrhizobium sp.]|uniref:NnrS family protein n=1 Tax=Bradyrhizobium sp. TaxID=376 RepID=UPI0025C70BC4|nr:NnrS family protein [Bradyrhizobium sp.]MBI5262211.1 NnrS family protein [Bradyrhizobium sp.]